jgi:hypothetical protein
LNDGDSNRRVKVACGGDLLSGANPPRAVLWESTFYHLNNFLPTLIGISFEGVEGEEGTIDSAFLTGLMAIIALLLYYFITSSG